MAKLRVTISSSTELVHAKRFCLLLKFRNKETQASGIVCVQQIHIVILTST